MIKKIFSAVLGLAVAISLLCPAREAAAADKYMSAEDAKYFLSFVYNADADNVEASDLSDDIYYKMLTGGYSGDKQYELAAQAAFLSFMDARIIQTLEAANVAVKNSSDYLIEYFSGTADSESTALVTGIYKEAIVKSIFNLCGGDEVLALVEALSEASEKPEAFINDVKAISSALTYIYGQNVVSLYTYFDAALGNMYLKSTAGAYETAMSYNIMALKESNFMGYAVKLIPGIESWEVWIDKMDYWAEFVHNMRGIVTSGETGKTIVVVFHPNCDEMDTKVLWYSGGQLYGPEMEREGYVFQGWYFDEECTDGPITNSYIPTESVILYAKWVDRYFTITFDSNCSEVEDYSYELDRLNDNWHEPEMKRAGHIFKGWYYDSACTEAVTGELEISGDMTFYAGWRCMYDYTVTNGKATLTYIREWEKDENGKSITDIIIPETVGNYPVEAVDVTNWGQGITGITFSDSVTRVPEWAFSYHPKLKYVVLGNGITTLEEGAFNLCYNLESVTFGTSLKTIADSAFSSCSKLQGIILPEGLVTIGNAFGGCSSLTEVFIPDSVTSVGERAFGSCTSIKSVTIGKGAANICGTTFGSEAIEGITVSEENPYYCSVDGVLYNKDKTVLIKYPGKKNLTEFTVPSTVSEIGGSAFRGSVTLEEINIGSNVKTLGEYAFYGCSKLKNAEIPDGITAIPDDAFNGCVSLENVTIPQTVKRIGSYAFSNCESLKEIKLPEYVEEIGDEAFSGCTGIYEITLPEGITQLYSGILYGCTSLEKVNIPDSVEYIGYSAFQSCAALKNIKLPKALKEIQGSAFSDCTALEKVVIPDGAITVYYYAFYNCTNLKEVVLPATIQSVGSDAFNLCDKLKEVYFMGDRSLWESVYVDEYGNERLINGYVNCDMKAVAEIRELSLSDNKVTGEICYDYLLEDMTVTAGLYEGERLVDITRIPVKKDAESTELSFDAESGKNYTVRAFFWNFGTLTPSGKAVLGEI